MYAFRNVRLQILTILFLSILVIAALFTALTLWRDHGIHELIQQRQQAFELSAEKTWQHSADQLDSVADDYSLWTDMFNFVTKPNKAWAQENIDESVPAFGVKHAWIVNKQGLVVYSFHVDREISQPIDLSILRNMDKQQGYDGVSYDSADDNGLLTHVKSMPIMLSDDIDREGAIAGWLVVGRDIKKGLLNEMSIVMAAEVELRYITSKTPLDTIVEMNAKTPDKKWQLHTHINLVSVDGKTVIARLSMTKSMPDLYTLYQSSWMAYYIVLATLSFLLMLNYFLLGKIIIKPLRAMNAAIDHDSVKALQQYMHKDNEIGHLSALIVDYFKQRQGLALEVKRQDVELSDVKQLNQNLKHLSCTDPLTKIHNRRAFDESINVFWRNACASNDELALVMIDIDFFKPYNDHYGHQQGDKCLHEVAQILNNHLYRQGDILARYGGEEFALILPNTDSEGATVMAQRLIDVLAEANIPHEYSEVSTHVTASMGVASMHPHTENRSDMLIALADSALYEAKKRGRDCVVNDDEVISQGAYGKRTKPTKPPTTPSNINNHH